MPNYFVPALDAEGKPVVRPPKKGEWMTNLVDSPLPIFERRDYAELKRLVAVCQRVVDGGMSYPKHDRDLAAEALAPYAKEKKDGRTFWPVRNARRRLAIYCVVRREQS